MLKQYVFNQTSLSSVSLALTVSNCTRVFTLFRTGGIFSLKEIALYFSLYAGFILHMNNFHHCLWPFPVSTVTYIYTCSSVVCHTTPVYIVISNRATNRTLYICSSHNHISLLDTGNISSNTREVSEVCTIVRECVFVFLSDSVFCLNEKIRLWLWNRRGIKNGCIPTAGPCFPTSSGIERLMWFLHDG